VSKIRGRLHCVESLCCLSFIIIEGVAKNQVPGGREEVRGKGNPPRIVPKGNMLN